MKVFRCYNKDGIAKIQAQAFNEELFIEMCIDIFGDDAINWSIKEVTIELSK